MKTNKYTRKRIPTADAVQLTEENFQEVLQWCDGKVEVVPKGQQNAGRKYILVPVINPMSERQTRAFVGDWVLYTSTNFKVYTNYSFLNHWEYVFKEDEKVLTEADAVAAAESSYHSKTDEEAQADLDSCGPPKKGTEALVFNQINTDASRDQMKFFDDINRVKNNLPRDAAL